MSAGRQEKEISAPEPAAGDVRTTRFLLGLATFGGAFLVFAIQPVMAKAILPWFGGSASVWMTSLLFFQAVLLLGYLYAYGLSLLPGRPQAAIHIVLLILAVAALPLKLDPNWKPAGGADPIPQILWILLLTAGGPYFLLSSTGPLVQSWFARVFHHPPYRLYALSNAGSLLALLGYPVLIEPYLAIRAQFRIWSALFAGFALACGLCAWRSRGAAWKRAGDSGESFSAPRPTWKQAALWLLFAMFPSALLLAVTAQLCQSVASIPFLWILPLTLYLVTFILVFERPWYRSGAGGWLLAAGLGLLVLGMWRTRGDTPLQILIPVFSAGFFLVCLGCHGELVLRRPPERHSPAFYLTLALGGAIGSLAVGLGAPYLLTGNFELPIVCAATGFFILMTRYGRHLPTDAAWTLIAVGLVVFAGIQVRSARSNARVMSRSFYGSLRVVDTPAGTPAEAATRSLVHGVISHGVQFVSPGRRREPTAYYGPGSGAGLVLTALHRPGLRAGIVGLGAGTLAVYGRAGEWYRFYEIDAEVARLAWSEFSFLREAAAGVDVRIGDGRQLLAAEPPASIDVLVVDAFSGDTIPLHLMTAEAFALYASRLKADGVLTLHISNTYLDLEPVVRRLAENQQWEARAVTTADELLKGLSSSLWMVAGTRAVMERLHLPAEPPWRPARRAALWTDDFSNPFRLLK